MFVLELATLLTLRDKQSIAGMGPAVAEALRSIVRDATNIHPMAVSRAVFYLIVLLQASPVSMIYIINVTRD